MQTFKRETLRFGSRQALTFVEILILIISVVGCAWLATSLFGGKLFGNKQGTVKVSIWLTTKSGESMKLSNVPIFIFDAPKMSQLIKAVNRMTRDKAKRDLELFELDKNTIKAAAQAGATYQLNEAKSDMRKDMLGYADTRNYFLHSWLLDDAREGKSPATAYTDIDGTTVLKFPDGNAVYYVLAVTERTVGNITEKDCWMERITPAKSPTLTLNNNNLFDVPTRGAEFGFDVIPQLPADLSYWAN